MTHVLSNMIFFYVTQRELVKINAYTISCIKSIYRSGWLVKVVKS